MLNIADRDPYPEWATPFTPSWVDNQWIVVFPDEKSCRAGLTTILENDTTGSIFAVAPYPGSETAWYVGVA